MNGSGDLSDNYNQNMVRDILLFIRCNLCYRRNATYQTYLNKMICEECKNKNNITKCVFSLQLFDISNYMTKHFGTYSEDICHKEAMSFKKNKNRNTRYEHADKSADFSPLLSIEDFIFSPINDYASKTNVLSESLVLENCSKVTMHDPCKEKMHDSTIRQRNKMSVNIILKNNAARNSRQDIYMCFSNLTKDQISYVATMFPIYKQRYGNLFLCKRISAQVTHLIINTKQNMCIRSYKYLYAGLHGIYILNFDFFVNFCQQENYVPAEYLFFIDGDLTYGRTTLAKNALRKTNLIFSGINFIIDEKQVSNKLLNLVALGGGFVNAEINSLVFIKIDNPRTIYDYISANEKLCSS